ncbi:MAG: hypothetical protein QOJ98_2023, partial [Acidobacteriota bacterium]|nr:hypothetical protein [Acidobacteriota bacterium]
MARTLGVLALFIAGVPARGAFAAVVQQVQSGTVTNNANGTQVVTISPVDTTKSFLIFQTRSNSTIPRDSTVRGRLQTSTTIEFDRVTTVGTVPDIDIQWYVVSFGSGVSVQRGDTALLNATTTDVVIGSVTVARSFVLFSKTAFTGAGLELEWSTDDAITGDLTGTPTTTNLRFRHNVGNVNHRVAWQVVTFTNAADINVQRGLITTMNGTTASVTATLSPTVNTAKTFVLASWRVAGTGVDIGSRLLRARLTNSSTVTIDRATLGSADVITEIAWQAIELKDASIVWSGNANFALGASQATASIQNPRVNVNRAVGFMSGQGGNGQSMGQSAWVTDGTIGVASATATLAFDQITLTRTNTAAIADVGWFVVQFDGGAPYKVGSFTKSVATGTQPIAHGLGQAPKAMLLWAEGSDIRFRGAAYGSTAGPPGTTAFAPGYVSGDSASGLTVSSPAFTTPSSNLLVLAFVSAGGTTSQMVTGVTGGGLTWVLAQSTNAQPGTAEVWRTFAPTTLSAVTITASLFESASASITVMAFTGIDTSGANGAGAIGATASNSAATGLATATLTTTRAGAGVVGAGNDTLSNATRTSPVNQSIAHQYNPAGAAYWMQGIAAPLG